MKNEEIRQLAARIINQVIDNGVTVSEIVQQYPELTITRDKSVLRALHALGHYESDSDIRQRDKDYAEMQIKALKAMANQLIQGLSLSDEYGYWQEK